MRITINKYDMKAIMISDGFFSMNQENAKFQSKVDENKHLENFFLSKFLKSIYGSMF